MKPTCLKYTNTYLYIFQPCGFPVCRQAGIMPFNLNYSNMKRALTILIIFVLTSGLNGQLKGQNLSDSRKSIIENQIDSIFLDMVEAAENVDYDKISAGVDDRHNAGFIVNNSYYSKYDTMIDILKANLRAGTKQIITFKNKKITVLSESIVLLTASGNANVELNTGQSFIVNFFWSLVYQKFDDEWKVIQSHQ